MERETAKIGYNMYRGWTERLQKWLQHVQRMETDSLQKWVKHVQRMDTERQPNVAKTCTEDGNRQSDKIGYNMYKGWTDRVQIVATT